MNRTEAEKLATAINVLRPDWPIASVVTLLGKHQHRTAHEATVALTCVAADPTSRTPARLAEDGPWWQAAAIATGAYRPHDDRAHTPPRASEACPRHANGYLGRCGGCRAEQLAAPEPETTPRPLTPAQQARLDRHTTQGGASRSPRTTATDTASVVARTPPVVRAPWEAGR